MGLFKKLRLGLGQGTKVLGGKIRSLFRGAKISVEDREGLEALLYGADLGREAVAAILEAVGRERKDLPATARAPLERLLAGAERYLPIQSPPEVICLLGVNGSGKTTTAAKLAAYFSRRGKKVLLGSCDTYRAAANEQLCLWAERLGVEIVRSRRGSDAASVAYDALSAAVAREKDLLILDTAGRLHTKEHLLQELAKLRRVLEKKWPEIPIHGWLVLDGHQGSNGLRQVEIFHDAFPLNGLIVTKLDGSACGGAIVSIYRTMKLPIYFIGLGEGAEDLRLFSVEEYLNALLGD
ncbi:MAG: signal recognition particle-docking protein FtsY [Puniceicoccales bacterium]|jgi:fused signal recognition particle receptor|nr:signal recognition particle-docking protein FtsY [Puniceicoccales bacterium]